jgi:hypothetical protein
MNEHCFYSLLQIFYTTSPGGLSHTAFTRSRGGDVRAVTDQCVRGLANAEVLGYTARESPLLLKSGPAPAHCAAAAVKAMSFHL